MSVSQGDFSEEMPNVKRSRRMTEKGEQHQRATLEDRFRKLFRRISNLISTIQDACSAGEKKKADQNMKSPNIL